MSIDILNFKVAGYRYAQQYRSPSDIVQVGESLILKCNQKNIYDDHSVEIYNCRMERLGYVPKFYSQKVFKMVMNSKEYHACVASYRDLDYPLINVSLKISSESTSSDGDSLVNNLLTGS
ncbi:hypothetical protein FLM52_06620 [bacterium Scap17]|nr:hypothetical protein [bacterium Scap17]